MRERKKAKQPKLTEAQILLAQHINELLWFPRSQAATKFEVAVCPGRRWRFDVAVPANQWAFECNGHFQGKHGKGWSSDAEKMNMAQALGWKVFVFTNREVLNGSAKAWIAENLLGGK